jgi:hypothetical protein
MSEHSSAVIIFSLNRKLAESIQISKRHRDPLDTSEHPTNSSSPCDFATVSDKTKTHFLRQLMKYCPEPVKKKLTFNVMG